MRLWGNALGVALCLSTLLAVTACASASPARDEPTATATATATAHAAGLTCEPKPSACGFPDTTNTGVTRGVPLTPVNGVVTLDQNGEVLENKAVTGGITVTAQNVTIRNVRLKITDPYYGIRVTPGGDWGRSDANLTVDHVEIDLNGSTSLKGIAFNGYTARNVFFHNGADCAHMGDNVVIQDSLCVDGPDTNSDGWPDSKAFCNGGDHFDGFQSDGGNNITVRHNTLRNPCDQTSNILLSSNTSHISNATVDNNLLAGGGYSLYCAGEDDASTVDHIVATDNVYSRYYFPKGGYWGPAAYCDFADKYSGNVWDGNYVPPPGTGGGQPGAPGAGGGPGTSPAAPTASGTATYFLALRKARSVTRTALKRRFHRGFTHRRNSVLRCKRLSRAKVACAVRWTARGHVLRHRYSGTVTVKHVKPHRWRYSLRIHRRIGHRKPVLVKHTRTL